jgi:hypothetical protein
MLSFTELTAYVKEAAALENITLTIGRIDPLRENAGSQNALMRKNIVAFTFGVWLLQQQPVLPYLGWAWMLLLFAVPAFLLWRIPSPILTAAAKILSVALFAGAGFFWAGCVCPLAFGRCAAS